MPSLAADIQAQERFEHLLSLVQREKSGRAKQVRLAFEMASALYGGKRHWTGQSLLSHALGVLETLLPFHPDEEAIVGCLLQHVLEEKEQALDEVQERFGEQVRAIVSGVHLLSHVTMRNRRMPAEHLRMMFLQVSNDMRVILITLCGQSYLLDHLHDLSPEERRRVCRDTLSLFAPVAARLGIYSLKHSLEARAFPAAYPTDSERISQQIQDLHRQYGNFLQGVVSALTKFLKAEGVQARIEAREKQPYSVFHKMQDRSISTVSELYDLFALRVIVDTEATCYQTLGLIHRLGHPVPQRFKDYIGFPKPNGYQSLHTTLAKLPGLPEGLRIEVQIRTEAMHREAEYGIAAHWNYKEGEKHVQSQLSRALAFQQAIERGKASALSDQIFVLTPKGDIIELPEGSTPLDFAFHVHTNLGLSFRAARVNGAIVPLTYKLENGDIVEILRYRDPRPSPRWTVLLKTASARSRLKRYFAEKDQSSLATLGRDMVNDALAERSLPPLSPDLSLLKFRKGKELSLEEREEWLAKVGQGGLKASALLGQLDAFAKPLSRRPKKKLVTRPGTAGPTVVADIPMPLHFSKCCRPEEQPGKLIVGIVREGEVRVHRSDCRFIKNANPERKVKVRWAH